MFIDVRQNFLPRLGLVFRRRGFRRSEIHILESH